MTKAMVDDIVNSGLHEYLDGLQSNMNLVGAQVAETFFAAKMAPPSATKRKEARA